MASTAQSAKPADTHSPAKGASAKPKAGRGATADTSGESVAEAAKKRAAKEIEGAQDAAADQAKSSADQVKQAAESFDEGSFARQATHRLAENLDHAAQSMRKADLGALQQDLTDFARRQPLVFFGGAALLGFAAARMLKASDRAEHDFDDLSHETAAPPVVGGRS